MTKKIIYAAFYFVLSGFILVFSFDTIVKATQYVYDYTYGISSRTPAAKRSVKEVSITIPEDATTNEIAETLKKEDLIADVTWFTIQSTMNSKNGRYVAGSYTLNTSMSDEEIMDRLTETTQQAEAVQIKFTVIEGMTVSEIAAKLENQEIISSKEFINAINNETFDYDYIQNIPKRNLLLEGYLFPDTYFLREGSTAKEIISKMLNRFDDIYDQQLRARTSILGLTYDEVITMASIVEKEISKADERALCSSVIYNRLNLNMKLQMCSTVLYSLGKTKDRLTFSDLEVNSPYNTYLHDGLPVGPICNPGEAAIRAVLYPNESDYLYFVLKDEETGEHVFTSDFQEFSDAKIKYNQKFY